MDTNDHLHPLCKRTSYATSGYVYFASDERPVCLSHPIESTGHDQDRTCSHWNRQRSSFLYPLPSVKMTYYIEATVSTSDDISHVTWSPDKSVPSMNERAPPNETFSIVIQGSQQLAPSLPFFSHSVPQLPFIETIPELRRNFVFHSLPSFFLFIPLFQCFLFFISIRSRYP